MRRLVPFTLLALFAPRFAAAHHDAAADMVVMANRFLSVLDDEQRKLAQYEWNADTRTFWHFVPDFAVKGDEQLAVDGKRFGLPVKQMTPQQQLFARGLLNSALSHEGLQATATIQALETVLHQIEKRDIRDPGLYYVSIHGEPGEKGTWSWRFEGHHLSINVTLVEGKVASVTPSFFGSNPHVVQSGPLEGTKVLAGEEEVARKLVRSLSPEQREKAVIAEVAPEDILTGEKRKADPALFEADAGIAFEELNADQQQLLAELVAVFTGKYSGGVVEPATEKEPTAPAKGARFAWAGPIDAGGHYYRIQTGEWLFEYDCTQNDANHVHAVWREFDGDFGNDLLAEHYRDFHGKTAAKSE